MTVWTPIPGLVVGLLAWRWWHRRRRDRQIERDLRRVSGGDVSVPILGPGLARIAGQARTLRLLLEALLGRARPPLLRESPWARRERCDQYDLALTHARRAMWDWLADLDRLAEPDRRLLSERGVTLRPFRRFLFQGVDRTDDPWEQVVWAQPPDLERIHREVLPIVAELRRVEVALAVVDDPYRAAG